MNERMLFIRSDRQVLISEEFARRFGNEPEVWVRAPGRVDLMGSHTDYNDGYVLTLSIDRDVWIAARPRSDRSVTVYSLNSGGGGPFDLGDIAHDEVSPWTNYVRGVAHVLQCEGYQLRGCDALIHSTVPVSSGLSSSAALEVATAMLFVVMGGWNIDPVQLALLCQRAENQFVGVNCGILDQYTSVMGQSGCALLLDCRNLTSELVPVAEDMCMVICDTRVKRELAGSAYAERRAQCEEGARRLARFYPADACYPADVFYPRVRALRDVTLGQFIAHEGDLPPVVARRCRFVIEENERVGRMGKALAAGDRRAIAELTSASYVGARDLYEIGSPEMAAMMDAMLGAPGVIAARQAGAGFGGCMMAYVDEPQTGAFMRHVEQAYTAATGIQPQIYPARAAAGAGPL
jgi:galactokinase